MIAPKRNHHSGVLPYHIIRFLSRRPLLSPLLTTLNGPPRLPPKAKQQEIVIHTGYLTQHECKGPIKAIFRSKPVSKAGIMGIHHISARSDLGQSQANQMMVLGDNRDPDPRPQTHISQNGDRLRSSHTFAYIYRHRDD